MSVQVTETSSPHRMVTGEVWTTQSHLSKARHRAPMSPSACCWRLRHRHTHLLSSGERFYQADRNSRALMLSENVWKVMLRNTLIDLIRPFRPSQLDTCVCVCVWGECIKAHPRAEYQVRVCSWTDNEKQMPMKHWKDSFKKRRWWLLDSAPKSTVHPWFTSLSDN